MVDCEYTKYGCKLKPANTDHATAHAEHCASAHLRLVLSALEAEVEKNRTMKDRMDVLEKTLSEQANNFRVLEKKVFELGSRPAQPAAAQQAQAPQQLQPAPQAQSASLSPSKPEPLKSGGSGSGVKDAVNRLSSSSPIVRPDSSVPARPHNSSSNISFPEQAKAHTMSTSKPEPLEEKSISSRLNRTKSSTLAKGFIPEAGWEVATIWEYDAVTESWARGITKLRLTSMPFAEGSLRNAHVCEIPDPVEETNEPVSEGVKDKNIKAGAVPVGLTKWTTGGFKYVIKISKTKVPIERYFEDVKMQIVCEELGKKFNNMGTPKKIDFLPAWVVELPRSPTMFCGLEPYIEGDFIKHANNHGMVLTDRNTPQAFSHFSWENTQHSLLVVDLQGVKDYYTDPQIHTRDGKGHGLGNLGMGGVDRFLKTHKCNAICQMLNLPAINQIDSSNSRRKVVKGTMMTPYIEDQLAHIPLVKMDIPDVLAKGEFTCVQTLSGHEDRVISIAISPRHLLSASSDGVVKAWNLPNFNLATTINAHRKSIECLAVSEKYFVTGSSDHCCKVWDFDNFNMVATLRDHLGDVNAVVLTDKTLGFLISASFDKTIKLWNMRTWKCVHTFEGHSKSVKTLALSGSILFSGSNDGSIMVWNLKYMSNIFTLQAHDGWVKTLQVRDKSLFSGGYDYLVKEWDLQSFNNISTFQEHNDNISSLLLTDRYLISGSDDKTIMVWDLATKKLVSTIKGHRLGVQALTTDGKHIISGSDDYSVKVWKWND